MSKTPIAVIDLVKGLKTSELVNTAKELKARAEAAVKHAKEIAEHADIAAKHRDQCWIDLGHALAELKKRKPKGTTWPGFVREHFDYSQQRADELIRIAVGKTTVKEVRQEKRLSVKKSRAKPTLRSVEIDDDEEDDEPGETPEEQRARLARGAQHWQVVTEAWAKDHPTPPDLEVWSSCAATPAQEAYWLAWLAAFEAQYRQDQKPPHGLADQEAAGNA